MVKLCHPPSLAGVSVHRVQKTRRVGLVVALVVVYVLVLAYVFNTVGLPYQQALDEVEAMYNDKNLTKRRLLREEKNIGTDDRPMPGKHLPSAGASVALFLTITMHVLFHMLCRWLPWFRAMTLFEPSKDVVSGCYVEVQPHPHRGKADMCLVKQSAWDTSGKNLEFEFQRQKYIYVPPSDMETVGDTVVGDTRENGAVVLMPSPIDFPLSEYTEASEGLLDVDDVKDRVEMFGANRLSIATPQFHELLKEQLLGPIAMFQIFCAVLWLLDEYWQFTLFSIFSIVALECTTAFQRQRTLGTLNKMQVKPHMVNCYRFKKWAYVSTLDLLPGDLISIKYTAPQTTSPPAITDGTTAVLDGQAKAGPKPPALPSNDAGIVPCDCLLLRGSAVVNEATLTGESVPQMKDALVAETEDDKGRLLDMEKTHAVNTLYSGTSLINSTTGAASKGASLPETPDGGCLCFVLRTGFNSSQGKLVQMIEFSQETVSADSRETLYALFVLLIFAIFAAGYVLKKGMEKGDRTQHELMLKCVIIITSVVPRQLPMQMAIAVNTALMALMKAGLYCTEPYRVPFAGKITHCLFDKTGTLTTDKLVPVGVVNCSTSGDAKAICAGSSVQIFGLKSKPELNGVTGHVNGVQAKGSEKRFVVKVEGDDTAHALKSENIELSREVIPATMQVNEASVDAAMVLAGCHSMVQVEGAGLVGDPIELAALHGVEWRYDPNTQTAQPGSWEAKEQALKNLQHESQGIKDGTKKKREMAERIAEMSKALDAAKERAKRENTAVRILHRHHFASKLQRMSVVVSVDGHPHHPKGNCCLVKGSPEAVKELLAASPGAPWWFDKTYKRLAERGMRVLALASKWWPEGTPSDLMKNRDWVESDLTFCGFIAFACKTRADSGTVVKSLMQSDHKVTMVTGDAPLTALFVASQTGITSRRATDGSADKIAMLLTETASGGFSWVAAVGDDPVSEPFEPNNLPKMSDNFDLITSEKSFFAAAEQYDQLWDDVDCIRVFARMSPEGKAKVISEMQDRKTHAVLMCGDGGNDVGALKQADVGLALLSGYGNANTAAGDENEGAEGEKAVGAKVGKEGDAEEELNAQAKMLKKKMMDAQKVRKNLLAQKQKDLSSRTQEMLQEELKARAARGQDTGMMGNFAAMQTVMARIKNEMAKEQQLIAQKQGNLYNATSQPQSAADALKAAEEAASAQGELQMIRPGDASVAAPFTSRAPSVRSVVDLIRQGRCTLLSALQQQQIMMLECMISAYTLSALSLEGARSSERQMMASGWLLSIASLAFSYASPIDKMSPIRPIKSLFHPAIFISILGQAAIHLGCMVYAVKIATEAMGPDLLKEVMDFHKNSDKAEKEREKLLLQNPEDAEAEEDPWAEMMSLWSRPFKPNLLNSVVFLVETSQIISVLFVNYKGRPWMKGCIENHPLFLSVVASAVGVACCAWEVSPFINEKLHLEAFPNDEFRWTVMCLVTISFFGTLIWDRIVIAIFAPDIFKVMLSEAASTKFADLLPLLMTVGKGVGGLLLLVQGNLIVLGLCFFAYRRYKQQQEAAAEA